MTVFAPQSQFRKIIGMVVLPFALIALPIWWREKMSWRPYPLPVKFCARSIAFSPDSRYVAVGEFGLVNVWDTSWHRLSQTIKTGGIVGNVAFSPDGNILACATGSNYVMLYDWRKGSIFKGYSISGSSGGGQGVGAMAFLADGQTLAIGLSNGDFQLLNLQTSQARSPLKGSPNNYKQGVAISADGKTFARSAGGDISLYDTQTAKVKRVLTGGSGGGGAIALSEKEAFVAAIGNNEALTIWNGQTGEVLKTWPAKVYLGISLLALSPDGSKVSDGYHLWDVATGKLEKETPGTHEEGLAISPDGRLLGVGLLHSAELYRIK